jgi:hypothetical protein
MNLCSLRSSAFWLLAACTVGAGTYGCNGGDDDDDGGGRGGTAGSGGSAGKAGAGKGGTAGKGGFGGQLAGKGGQSGSAGEAGGSSGEGGEAGGGAAGEAGTSAGEGGGAGAVGTAGESGNAGAAGSGADTTAPVITRTGPAEMVLDCGGDYTEPGVSALDAEDGVVEVTTTGVDAIDTTAPGRFVVEYAAEDAAGNRATASRVVNVCGPNCGDLGKEAIDHSAWTTIQYEFESQPHANWVVATDGLSVLQTLNADASILLSDFDATDLAIEGFWRMSSSDTDDDFVGFVFGYQDANRYYLFDWKRGTQASGGANALVGMTLKVVDFDPPLVLENGLYTTAFQDFWATEGTTNVRPIMQDGEPLHNDVPWEFNQDYRFFLEFHPGSFKIRVEGVAGVLESWSVTDDTFTDGRFGFFNNSQGAVSYSAFTERVTPPACSTVGSAD